MKVEIQNTALFVAHLKSALLCVSEDETRPHLNSLLIEALADGLRFVATDGHRLWIADMPQTIDTSGFVAASALILRSDVKKIVKAIDVKSANGVTIDLESRTVVQSDDTTVWRKLDGVIFPPYRQVLPAVVPSSDDDATPMPPIDPSYAADAADAYRTIAKVKQARPKGKKKEKDGNYILSVGIQPHSTGEMAPTVWTSPEVPEAILIIMPRRESHASVAGAVNATLARFKSEPKEARKAA